MQGATWPKTNFADHGGEGEYVRIAMTQTEMLERFQTRDEKKIVQHI